MKRDVDLSRRLLFDIESRGADCSISVLRTGANHETDERVRYHLRLLIDAGLLKEVDRAANGVPCVRLTDAGHELIELTRSDERWRQAKWACRDRIGGVSLTAMRAILTRWAMIGRPLSRRRKYAAPAYEFGEPSRNFREAPYQIEPAYADEPEYLAGDTHYVRVRPPHRNGWRRNALDQEIAREVDLGSHAVLPDYLI